MAQEKQYKVVSDFNDAAGKAWKAGQTYTGNPQEVQQQMAAGTITEDTSSNRDQRQDQRQQGRQ